MMLPFFPTSEKIYILSKVVSSYTREGEKTSVALHFGVFQEEQLKEDRSWEIPLASADEMAENIANIVRKELVTFVEKYIYEVEE